MAGMSGQEKLSVLTGVAVYKMQRTSIFLQGKNRLDLMQAAGRFSIGPYSSFLGIRDKSQPIIYASKNA
jgi:hypothetical protein